MEGLVPTQTALIVAAGENIEPRVGRTSLALAKDVRVTRTSGKGEFAVEIGTAESAAVGAGIKMRTAIVLLAAKRYDGHAGVDDIHPRVRLFRPLLA